MDLLEFQNVLIASPEWKRVSMIRHFQLSVELFDKNASFLYAMIEEYTESPDAIAYYNVANRWKSKEIKKDICFLLHNFVASAISLVDHSRVLYKKLHQKNNLFPDYKEEIKRRFVSNNLVQFVHSLRQMMQHYRLPNIGTELKFKKLDDGNELNIYLYLYKKDLLEFDNWNMAGKQYLLNLSEKIEIKTIIEWYFNEIHGFYDWWSERVSVIHKEDYKKIENIQKQAIEQNQDIFLRSIESDLELYRKGIGNVKGILSQLLSAEDQKELIEYDADLIQWTKAAIDKICKMVPIPEKLQAEIKKLVSDKGI